MTSPLEVQCLAVLRAASSAQFGVVLRTSNAAKARATLYRIRKDLGDVALAAIHIRVSPDDSEHELWLLRRSAAPGYDLSAITNE